MERRWGERLRAHEFVHVRQGDRELGAGWMRDVSLSGAYLETARRLPYMGRVVLRMLSHGRGRAATLVEGYITRVSPEGIGVEWCEFAPQAIVELLEWQQRSARKKAS